MAISATKKHVVDVFNASTKRTQECFRHVPNLIEQFVPEIAVGYVFDRVAAAHNGIIVAGLVVKYKAHRDVAREIAVFQECAWEEFHYEFQTVFGSVIPDTIGQQYIYANEKRRALLAGKRVSSKDQCEVVEVILQYADTLDEFVANDSRLHPFSDLSKVKPRGNVLDKESTRWVLKGMGFPVL